MFTKTKRRELVSRCIYCHNPYLVKKSDSKFPLNWCSKACETLYKASAKRLGKTS